MRASTLGKTEREFEFPRKPSFRRTQTRYVDIIRLPSVEVRCVRASAWLGLKEAAHLLMALMHSMIADMISFKRRFLLCQSFWLLSWIVSSGSPLAKADTLLSKQVYIGPGSWYNVAVPSTANKVVVKAWGSGGGGATTTYGGAGAYVGVSYYFVAGNGYNLVISVNSTNGGLNGKVPTRRSPPTGGSGGGGDGGGNPSVSLSSYHAGVGARETSFQVGAGGGAGTNSGQNGVGGFGTSGGAGSTGTGGSTTAGNGGTSYIYTTVPPADLLYTTAIGASGYTPANVNDADYPGGNVGYGGLGEDGGPGAVVISFYLAPRVPAISSSLAVALYQGQVVSYATTATHSPTSYSATGLPAGLSINSSTGVVSGTATTTGTSNSTISATNAAGTGNATVVWTVAVDATAPTVPTGLQAATLSSTSHRLTWTPSTDAYGVTAYEVKRDSTSLGTVSSNTIDVTGLTASTTYAMTVRARDGAGNWSAWSSALSVVQGTVNAPAAPGALNYADRTDTSITLLWAASLPGTFPVVGYKVFRGGTEIATVDDVTFSDTGLPANTSQTYTVKAVDSAGNLSAASSALVVSTTQNATLDSDGDGVPNAMETVMGTNPSVAGTNDSTNQTQLKINHPSK